MGDYSDKGVFTSGLSGSLTQLSDGRSFIAAGDNMTVTSASNGQIVVASSGGTLTRSKITQKVTYEIAANTTYTLTGSDMSDADYDPSYIDIFLNGQLLLSGTQTEVNESDADYTVTGASTAKFSFGFDIDDIVSVIIFNK